MKRRMIVGTYMAGLLALVGCGIGSAGTQTRVEASQATAGGDATARVETASAEQPTVSEAATDYDRPGFVTQVDDEGRLWVWAEGEDREQPGKHVTFVSAGPDGRTVKAIDRETGVAYLVSKPGFKVAVEDGRLWVWREDEAMEKPGKHVTMVGVGPRGMTLKAIDRETLVAYQTAAEGFTTEIAEDGRLWVWPEGEAAEKPGKHVTVVGRGPMGLTVKAIDRETVEAYLAAVER